MPTLNLESANCELIDHNSHGVLVLIAGIMQVAVCRMVTCCLTVFTSAVQWHSGDDKGRAGLAAVGTWQQDLLIFSLPDLQPLQSEELGEVLPLPLPCSQDPTWHCHPHSV